MNDKEEEGQFAGLSRWMKAHEGVILSAIVLTGFLFRLSIYFRYPYPFGIDGPYYNLQVESIIKTGWLYTEDTPLVFYFFTLLTLILGDITLSIKVGSSMLSSLIAVPTFYLTKRITKIWWAGEVAAFISLFNPIHIRLLDDFLKNIAGILFLLAFLNLFLETCESPKPMNYALSFSLLIATFLTHIHPSGLCVLFILGYIALLWLFDGKPPKAEIRVSVTLFASLLLGLFIAVVLVPGALVKMSKVLYFISSFEEVELEQLSIFGMKTIFYLFSIPIVLGLTYIIQDLRGGQSRGGNLLLASILATSLFLALPIIPHEWRWRFALGNFIPLSLLGGYGLGKAERDLPKLVFMGLVAVLLSSSLIDTWNHSQRLGPLISESGIRELEELRGKAPEESVIIVLGPFFYWVQWVTGLRTFHGKQNPMQLYQDYGGPVLLIMEKGSRPNMPEIQGRIVLDDGPYTIYQMFPR